MEIKKNTDRLLAQTQISRELYENIMEGKSMKRRFSIKRAALPAAAAILIMNVMYVGASCIIENTSLREYFIKKEEAPLTVPETQIRQDIYSEIAAGSLPATGNTVDSPGSYGEMIIDNDLFSIEVLEKTCTGRELNITYILTQKTQDTLIVQGFVDTAFDACSYESGFGDELYPDQLPADCGYELKENQRLCTITQLGTENYQSGLYQFYAEYFLIPEGQESVSGTDHTYFEASIEIIGNDDYGMALNGDMDKTEGAVHFEKYDVYISPLTVYLTLDGTYEGEMSSGWGMQNYHNVTIEFSDGTQTTAKVLLSGMKYGTGKINVNMNASFEAPVNPDNIVKVMLDDTVIL